MGVFGEKVTEGIVVSVAIGEVEVMVAVGEIKVMVAVDGIDVFVDIGITVGIIACPDPQADNTKLMTETSIIKPWRFLSILSPTLSQVHSTTAIASCMP